MIYKVFKDLVETLDKQHDNFHEIAEDAKVHISTLKNWCNGNVSSPQLRTLYNVAFVLGFDVKLAKSKTK